MNPKRKAVGSKSNPEYETAPYEIVCLDKSGKRLLDRLGQKIPFMPYRYATLEHAEAAMKSGADPEINTAWPFIAVYEDELNAA